ncbi:hypothetical protein PLICRDRAFT_80416, partial [Plicaturopsis crispa FD-325 SS-3]
SPPHYDIILRSSDGIYFPFLVDHLKVHSAFFELAHPSFSSPTYPPSCIDLPEKSSTLTFLLAFMSRQRPPTVQALQFDDLLALAQSVQNYRVYSAMASCKRAM